MVTTLFLAWQDHVSRQWFPIGRLRHGEGGFEYLYVRGYEDAHARAGLRPLPGFPDTSRVYRAPTLFPMFNNRIMSRSREEFTAYLRRLDLEGADADPLSILARSLGRRTTDSFEVFPFPIDDKTGLFDIDFFVHGLRHRSADAQSLAASLTPGTLLSLEHDAANADDPNAVAVRAEGVRIGFVPRYYAPDLVRLLAEPVELEAKAVTINAPPAPVQQRVLCHLAGPWPFEAPPFEREDFVPLPESARLAS
ncbi:MAG: HIRAN domain-containing protein [Deltaproteobacteria bacterium]